MPTITALYAGLLGLLSLYVSFQAGRLRGQLNVPVGDGGKQELLLAMRRHANFVEYVPIALILIGLLEMNNAASTGIHLLGFALLVTRISHAIGIKSDSTNNAARIFGAAGTALVILIASVWAVTLSF